MPEISALERLEDCPDLEASLGYRMTSYKGPRALWVIERDPVCK